MERMTSKNIALQILLWGGVWVFISLILTNGLDHPGRLWRKSVLSFVGIGIIIFVNLKWLLPQLFFKKKTGLYILASVLLLAVVSWLLYADIMPWNESDFWRVSTGEKAIAQRPWRPRKGGLGFFWFGRTLPFFVSLLGSTLIAVSQFANAKEKEAIQLERSKLETEVKFLKSQINPHFLFNSLHNIYALTVMKADHAPDQLLKLSDILRYMLYDSNEAHVPLRREIEYLKNYISLVRLKDSRGMGLKCELDESQPELMIAPLLFIPFVENAVKHSQIEDLKKGYINISLVTWGNSLKFMVENSISQKQYTKDKVGGIGLSNIKQRLQLLYPDKHRLEIDAQPNKFNIQLEIDCA